MGCLRADSSMPCKRYVIERRARSIGTVAFRSQWKRSNKLVFACAALLTLVIARVGRAQTASEPLPPAPPQPAGAPSSEPLPPPPPPRAAPIPPTTAAVVPPLAPLAEVRPGTAGSDLPAVPPAPRGVNFHDGFYLRLALGAGVGGALVSSDSKAVGDYSFSGGSGALDLWVGGTPTPGLAMGAAFSAFGVNSASRREDGARLSGDVTGSTALLGYFVDVFPDPERGLHFGGALGLASGNAEIEDVARKFRGGGLGLQAFGGYDFWVSPQWSLGGMLRLMGSITRDKADDVSYEASIGGATLSFTALYH